MCITSLAFVRIAKKHIFFFSKDELISVRIIYKWEWKRKKIEEKKMLQKNFFERQLRHERPSSCQRKSLLFKISSTISFHDGEL